MMLYAIHDALVKPMPNDPEQLCLAESYAPSEDGLSHEFILRDNARFHNGEPVTAEDVKFPFGATAAMRRASCSQRLPQSTFLVHAE